VKLQWDRWPPVPLRGGWRPFQTQVTAVTELGTSRRSSRTTEQSLGPNRMDKEGYRGTHHL